MRSRNQELRRALALATVVGAIAAPAASAARLDPQGVDGYRVYSPNTDRPQPEPVPAADEFDWGDAGIGAAGMFAVGAIVAGATVAVGHRPRRGHRVA